MAKKMKCTDSWQLGKQLRNGMMEELVKAVQAHGGSYSWYNEETEEFSDDAPVVMCNHRYAGPVDVKIRRIYIDKWGCLNIEAVDDENGGDIKISLDDIAPHHMSFIIEAIPVTSEVKDVSSLSTSVSILQDDYLQTLQAFTFLGATQVKTTMGKSYIECFKYLRQWTKEFVESHTDIDWDEIDEFIYEKLENYDKQDNN